MDLLEVAAGLPLNVREGVTKKLAGEVSAFNADAGAVLTAAKSPGLDAQAAIDRVAAGEVGALAAAIDAAQIDHVAQGEKTLALWVRRGELADKAVAELTKVAATAASASGKSVDETRKLFEGIGFTVEAMPLANENPHAAEVRYLNLIKMHPAIAKAESDKLNAEAALSAARGDVQHSVAGTEAARRYLRSIAAKLAA